ncbi:CLAVATA3/ESR (CLE)-related protein 5-like [Populus alba x Populus x berolinensis]|nr:CLAVATA3/ESR (CLE)-related protein 5-like [Populus alba x Populus x berolinensis]
MILLLMVLFSAIFLTSEARILKGGQALQGNANNSHLLLELGFDRSKLEHYRRLSTLGVPSDRVTPAGPDHHHY